MELSAYLRPWMTAGWLRADRPLVLAHRGLMAHVPEQTTASFQAAIDRGAEMIEADGQLSSDGQLVLMHDVTVDRTTNGSGRVADLSWDELSRLDAGSWFHPRYTGLGIPLATELVELAGSAGVGLCLEAKGATPDETARVAVRLAQLVRDRDALSWAFVASFDHHALIEAKRAVPDLLLAPERLPSLGPQAVEESLRQATALGAPVLQHRWEVLTAELVETLHGAGVAVWAWLTNDERSARVAIALGADGLFADDISVLVDVRARLCPPG
jgi:glycerophosphoryl diester phosphodiesterase